MSEQSISPDGIEQSPREETESKPMIDRLREAPSTEAAYLTLLGLPHFPRHADDFPADFTLPDELAHSMFPITDDSIAVGKERSLNTYLKLKTHTFKESIIKGASDYLGILGSFRDSFRLRRPFIDMHTHPKSTYFSAQDVAGALTPYKGAGFLYLVGTSYGIHALLPTEISRQQKGLLDTIRGELDASNYDRTTRNEQMRMAHQRGLGVFFAPKPEPTTQRGAKPQGLSFYRVQV